MRTFTAATTAFTLLLTAALARAAAPEAIASTPASSGTDSAPAAVASHSGFQLKNRSSFTASSSDNNNSKDARDPFWPVGWVKAASRSTTLVAAPAALTLKAENFVVSAILLNDPPLAVINGKEMAEGQIAQVRIDNQTLSVQLASIQDGQIVLRYRDQNLVIPLHRRGETTQPRDISTFQSGGKTALR